MIQLMNMTTKIFSIFALLIILTLPAFSAIDTYVFDNPRQEAQYRALIAEFRCPKCQNQNLAGSDAPIAQDLKQKTYEMVKAGRSDAEIRKYMNDRYGDFISYKPPVRPSTWILWFFPPLLLVVVLFTWFIRNRNIVKRTKSLDREYEANLNTPLTSSEQNRLNELLKSNANDDVNKEN